MSGGNWKDLFKAAREGNTHLVDYHLRNGVDPNFQHAEYMSCPIFEAIRHDHLEIVRMLIEQGQADPSLAEELTEQTPIEAALEAQNFEIVDYINSKLEPTTHRIQFQNVLVTGGNRGIRRAIVESLLRKGHRVVLTCRLESIGRQVCQELKEATRNSKVDYIVGDLSCIVSSLALARAIATKFPSINVLVHNAGVWPTQLEINEDGLEQSFCVNYMGPYLLTRELGPLLGKNASIEHPSRIVFVSGKIYVKGRADLALTPYGKDFGRFATYPHTKQCGVLLFLNTARRFEKTNKNVRVNAVHPGVIRTGLGEPSPSSSPDTSSRHTFSCSNLILKWIKKLWKDPAEGAVGPVWLAESSEAAHLHGKYFDENCQEEPVADNVKDDALQRDWEQWTIDFLASHEKTTTPGHQSKL